MRSLLILSAALFLAEVTVMRFLEYLPEVDPWLHYVLDSTMMLLLSFPALYFFVLQPLHRQIEQRRRIEAELRGYRESLEQTVAERTRELQRSNTELQAAREDLNRAQAVARTGSWRLDVRRDQLLWSDETYRIFGISPGTSLTYELFLEHVLPEDRQYVDRAWKAALQGHPYDIEHRIVVGSAVKWVREKAELEMDANGGLSGGFGTVQDITELKAAEAERERLMAQLARERAMLNLIMENTRAQLAYLDANFNLLHVNSAFERGFGHSREQLIGRSVFDLFPKSENEAIFRKVRDTGEPVEFFAQPLEFPGQPGGGVTFWDWTLVCMQDSAGQVEGLVLSLMDVTAAKRAEMALRETEERVRQALHVGRMFAFDWECESDVVIRSPHCAEILGLQDNPIRDTGQGFFARVHAEDRRSFLSLIAQLNPANDTYRTTYRVVRPDGSVISLEEAARASFDSAGKLVHLTGISADVTRREQAQRDLKWELAVNEAVSAMFGPLISNDATIEHVAEAVSNQVRKLTASPHCVVTCIDPVTKDNVCHTFTEMMKPGGAWTGTGNRQRLVFRIGADGRYPALWGHALNTKQGFYTNEPSDRHPAARGLPEGHLPIERLLAVPVLIGSELMGEILVANSSRDYTDQDLLAVRRLGERYALAIRHLRFKQALQAERDFVGAILATAGALVVVLDSQARIVRLNPAFEQATGYTAAEALGKSFCELFIPPEDVEDCKTILSRLQGGQFPIQGESCWRAKGGAARRVLWSYTVLLDEHQATKFVICTAVDVTEARAVEDKLRVLTRAMEAGPAGVVITDKEGTISYVNRALANMTGYSPEDVVGHHPRLWKSGCHSKEYYAELWQAIKEGRVWRGEFCNRRKNGELFWVYSTISPVGDASGEVRHLVAVTVDITKRKQVEQELKQAHQDLERKVDQRTADLNASLRALSLENEARRRAEAELSQLLQLERLLTEISTAFAAHKPGHFQEVLQDAVSRLMEFLRADAATLAEFVGNDTRVAVHCQAAGNPSASERLPLAQLPWTLKQLRQQQRVCFAALEELPPEAAADLQGYRRSGTESVLALPLVVSQETIGALAFIAAGRQHNWPAETVARMRMVENLFSSQLLRWRSEQALSEAETRFHAIADFVRDWEYWESPEGSLLFCSPACEPITGYRPEQFLVDPSLLKAIVLPEDAGVWQEHHREAFERPQAHSLEFRIRRVDEQVRWIQHYRQPIFDVDGGQFLGFRVNNRDITGIRQTELETQHLRVELSRMARATMADQLAASLAHELRQPLTAIMTNAEAAAQFLAQQPPDLKEVQEALRDIMDNDERASEVIRRLRALYRKTGLERAALDLNKVIEETLVLLRSELILRRVSWRIELAPRLAPAFGNRIELQQVLMNLVLNASDAMAGVDPNARLLVINTRPAGPGHLQVAVRDSGAGFAPEAADKMFEPFFTTKESGMGIGLTLCRSIIQAHGGRLWAENNPGGGATFYFTVPVLQETAL